MTASENIHAFTSININYLPRARVLGQSIRKHHPEIKFHLMLSDEIPDWMNIDEEPFDSIIRIVNLAIEDQPAWIYKHDVVELCTAVKPFAFLHIMDTAKADKVFYFDPDVVIFSRFDEMIADLDKYSGILTPHVCAPEVQESAIVDNEISCLKHGINNLGFLAVNSQGQGRELIEWWSRRLLNYCYDDIPRGLFTDQRWMDFAHVFFDQVKIDKGPQYNVATWNYTTRVIDGNLKDGITVNDKPLCFHHFSGFTNGAAEMMQGRYAKGLRVIDELYDWYQAECEKAGQSQLEKSKWPYAYYSNGEAVERSHRLLYRAKPDLQKAFPEPLQCTDDTSPSKSYYYWLLNNSEKLNQAVSTGGFPEFLTSTENALYGYIDRARKPGKLVKTSSKFIVRGSFFTLRKFLSLLNYSRGS